MRRETVAFALALAVLAVTGAAVYLPREIRDVALAGPLHGLPLEIAGWRMSNEAPPSLPDDPAAREPITRAFRNGDDVVWATVFYYPRQTEGNRGRGRDLVFPSDSWADLTERDVRLAATVDLPALSAHAVNVRVRDQRWTVLYWYDLRGSTLASEHWYRAGLLYNRLVHRRADSALVRLVWRGTIDFSGEDDRSRVAFTRGFQAELRRFLPE